MAQPVLALLPFLAQLLWPAHDTLLEVAPNSMELIALLIFAIFFAFFCSGIASQKGHAKSIWLILGFLFGPIALVAIAGMPDRYLRNYIRALAAAEGIDTAQIRKDTMEQKPIEWSATKRN